MGLLKALGGAVGGVLGDTWKEYFYCDAIDADTLVVKGKHRAGSRSSNTSGTENVITKGSIIAVADGQCMLIVDNGKVVDVCAEPGVFECTGEWAEPSIFSGSLGTGIVQSIKEIGKRFTFGGEPPKDMRVYYVNTKELIGNKYGTAAPVPFRVVDARAGIDIDIGIKCFGEYSYRVADPVAFFTNVCGNVSEDYGRENIDSQLKTELLTALQPAFAIISEMGVRYSALPGRTTDIAEALNKTLSDKWRKLRGLEIVSFGISSLKADEEDEKTIKEMQRNAAYRDPTLAAATLVGAQAQAMRDAANNSGGAMMGFMGMGMAAQQGGFNAQNLYAMGQQQQAAAQQPPAQPAPAQPAAGGWKCECGASVTGKFCPECGKPRPQPSQGWTCSCGATNQGRFCQECGKPKPAGAPLYKCDKCGWQPADPKNPPRFCPECGDPFDTNDIVG